MPFCVFYLAVRVLTVFATLFRLSVLHSSCYILDLVHTVIRFVIHDTACGARSLWHSDLASLPIVMKLLQTYNNSMCLTVHNIT